MKGTRTPWAGLSSTARGAVWVAVLATLLSTVWGCARTREQQHGSGDIEQVGPGIEHARPKPASPGPSAKESPEASAQRRQRAVAELVRRLSPRLERSARGLATETDAEGREHVHLQGRFGHAVMVRRGADGQLVYGCAESTGAARRFLEGRPSEVSVEGMGRASEPR